MLQKKVPFYFVVIAFVLPSIIACYGFISINKLQAEENDLTTNGSMGTCSLNVKRLQGYQFVHPLLYAEPACESPELSYIKSAIESELNSNKSLGNITSASVYLRAFGKAEWTVINENEKFSPGSLLKVPELITLYKMNELQPGFLDKTVNYTQQLSSHKNTTFTSKHIQLGKSYSIRQLMQYMIMYSDNDATLLLNQILDRDVFTKVFTDAGLSAPDYNAMEYLVSAKDYSIFMKELYNSTYLSTKDSEACLELLSKTDFNKGMISGLPDSCMVSHKFGEGGLDNAPNLSESGIVYCGNKPFLLTVMTKGTDMKVLAKVISEITKKTYDMMSQRS